MASRKTSIRLFDVLSVRGLRSRLEVALVRFEGLLVAAHAIRNGSDVVEKIGTARQLVCTAKARERSLELTIRIGSRTEVKRLFGLGDSLVARLRALGADASRRNQKCKVKLERIRRKRISPPKVRPRTKRVPYKLAGRKSECSLVGDMRGAVPGDAGVALPLVAGVGVVQIVMQATALFARACATDDQLGHVGDVSELQHVAIDEVRPVVLANLLLQHRDAA